MFKTASLCVFMYDISTIAQDKHSKENPENPSQSKTSPSCLFKSDPS